MYARESLKRVFEHLTGVGLPSRAEAGHGVRPRKAWISRFEDDGAVPNHPRFPLIHYRGAVKLDGDRDPAAVFEQLFERNGWSGSWRNGIYDYVHYHPRTHEVLGIARGKAKVRFGGGKGKTLQVKAGDVVILPAGTGHQALRASGDLLVVGAYPSEGSYDEYRASKDEHDRAKAMIAKVPVPKADPVYGRQGPLRKRWTSD